MALSLPSKEMPARFTLILALFASPLLAAEKQRAVTERPFSPKKILQMLDVDKDGALSKTEFAQARRVKNLPAEAFEKIFAQLDRDKSGMIDVKELRQANRQSRPKNSRKNFKRMIKKLDVNQDNKITRDEFNSHKRFKEFEKERRDQIFKKMDQNGDGVLTKDDSPKESSQIKTADPYFRLVDRDRSGTLDINEFIRTEQAQRILKNRFDWLDHNKDGVLTQKELYNQVERKPTPPSKKDEQADTEKPPVPEQESKKNLKK